MHEVCKLLLMDESDYMLSDVVSSFANENAVIDSVEGPHFIYLALIYSVSNRGRHFLTSVNIPLASCTSK